MRRLVGVALFLGAFMTAAGALAPIFPQADMTNHFRPYTLAGSCGLLVLALAARRRDAVRWGALLIAINAALLLLPLLWSAETSGRQAAEHRDLKIVTFNLAWKNRHVEDVADFLLREDADIVLLQEMTEAHAAALRSSLAGRYPHSQVCLVPEACRQAIFSKRPWSSVEDMYRSIEAPDMLSALFDDVELGRFRIHSVHTAVPFRLRQARQVDRLIAWRNSITGPAIFAGDFNMTPWSYQMQRLLVSTGLRRHATFLRSWPTDRQSGLPAPAFLIDHVLTTPDIATISITTGPNLGSDHLPIVARLRLPAS